MPPLHLSIYVKPKNVYCENVIVASREKHSSTQICGYLSFCFEGTFYNVLPEIDHIHGQSYKQIHQMIKLVLIKISFFCFLCCFLGVNDIWPSALYSWQVCTVCVGFLFFFVRIVVISVCKPEITTTIKPVKSFYLILLSCWHYVCFYTIKEYIISIIFDFRLFTVHMQILYLYFIYRYTNSYIYTQAYSMLKHIIYTLIEQF